MIDLMSWMRRRARGVEQAANAIPADSLGADDRKGPDAWRSSLWVYAALLADVVIFFHKPLFSLQYLFPWDFRGVQLPMVTFLTDQLRDGRFALWNPYTYCGYPVFANIEACFFHPLVLLSALIASRTSLSVLPMLLEWMVVLQVWLAGIAAYRLFRDFGAGRASAWAGAVIFQTGGFFASRAEHIGSMMAVAWMPLAWLAVVRLRRGLQLRWLAALSAALGMSVLGGFPQPTLVVFVSTAALSAVLVLLGHARVRSLLYTACACLLGLSLAAVQFIPTAQLERHSVAKYRAEWLGTGGGLYWQSLVSFVLPNHYDIFDMSRFHGPGDVTFLYLYCSIAGLLLALFALATRRNRSVGLLAIMALFGLFWTLGDKTALWRWTYPLLPEKIRIGIHPEYAYAILTLAVAGLAAIGLGSLRVKELARWAIGLVIAADLFLTGSGRPMNCASVRQEPGATREAFDGNRALLKAVRDFVDQDNPPSRIDTTAEAGLLWAVAAPITQVPTANGISPLALENIIQLRLFLHDGARWGWNYPVEKLDSPVLDLLNVRYLIAGGRAAERAAALPRFRRAASLPGNEMFENLTVMPRFFLVHRVRPVASLAEARGVIERREIDFRQAAISEETIALQPAAGAGGADEVQVVDYRPASLELAVRSRGGALLVASDNYYPGWKAWLDDRPAPIHRVDIAFRGVIVPDGAHRVRMAFEPVILPVSLAISLLTGLFLLFLAFRRRRADPISGAPGDPVYDEKVDR